MLMFETRYASLEDALRQAAPEIRAHLARTREFHARGDLLDAGAFRDADAPLSTMAISPAARPPRSMHRETRSC
jgi:hypothetical protein